MKYPLLILCLMATAAQAAEPWEGTWVPLDSDCGPLSTEWTQHTTRWTSTTEQSVDDEICDIKKVQPLSVKSSWRVDAVCVEAGDCDVLDTKTCAIPEKWIIMLDKDDHLLTFGDGWLETQKRCK